MNENSRIRNEEHYLHLVPNGEPFHVVCEVTPQSETRLKKIGFQSVVEGERVLPRGLGSVSKRNSDGYDIVYRDRPKESYVISFMAPGWHNTRHWVHITRWRYPRKHIDGYEIELTLMRIDDKLYAVSPELIHTSSEGDRNKHVLNLFLELFGDFELRKKELSAVYEALKITRVNWTMLPVGEYPFSRLEEEGYLPRNNKTETVYRHSDEVIRRYNPSECVIGNGGFTGYIAFVFPDRNITIMEHYRLGNATYVFDMSWEELSKKTKAEIMGEDLAIARIIHTNGWTHSMNELFLTYPSH